MRQIFQCAKINSRIMDKMNRYRVIQNGDRWEVHKKKYNGWERLQWFYMESDAWEYVAELKGA